MSSSVRYEVLHNQDENEEIAQPVSASAEVMESQQTDDTDNQNNNRSEVSATQSGASADAESTDASILCPPPYNIATDLPSYEEAERTKQEEAARREREATEDTATQNNSRSFAGFLFPSREQSANSDRQLGTDSIFLCTFLLGFVFNWIGLLGSMCITETIAGRLGAMSGFGLSLVKWVAIMKHSHWAGGLSQGDSWLWWLLIVMGFLIFLRGCTQYLRIKYHWARLNQNVRNNIFYYF